jgi:O-antigen/teichoic acid export membrane protein
MGQIKPLSLRRNFSWTFVGNFVYAACQWGMLVVLAKLGSPEKVGQFTLGLAVATPVIMLTNLQLRSLQVTDAKQEYFFQDYLGLRLIMAGLALLIISLITFTAGYRWETSLVILAIAIAKVCESVTDICHGLIQQHERMDRIAISLIIQGPLSLFISGVGFYITNSVIGAAIGLIIARLLVLWAYDFPTAASILNTLLHPQAKKLLPSRWHFPTLIKLIWLALPLGIVMMLLSLNSNIPRYFIERNLGERSLGIFAALSYLMVAGNIVIQALAESASAKLAKYYASGDRLNFGKLLLQLIAFGTILGGVTLLVVLVAGRQILTLLYGSEYAQHQDLFVLLMLGAAIDYAFSFLGHAMTSARYFRVQLPLFSFITTISAITCLWLMPTLGLQGAAIASIIGSIVRAILTSGVIFHALHIRK